MEWLHFLYTTLSFLGLLIISSTTYIIANRYKIPYTVLLVAVWIILSQFASIIPWFWFIDDFILTPEILLYIFLPVLLFESAYNMRFRDLINNIGSISLLAIISLCISTLCIGWGLYYIFEFLGFPISFTVALLFWSLISATDPVSVLALFKELWAPKRLTLIFEWESLFNDGTALALFLVILSFVIADTWHPNAFISWIHTLFHGTYFDIRIITGIFSFLSMVLMGICFGAMIGILFSKTITLFGKNKILELTLTIVLAHITFILADLLNHFILPVSGVIATTIAALVVGNYGRYKLSHETRITMNEYWEFFAHIANSIVFLLVGVMIVSLHISWWTMILPIGITIIIVMVARAISVYGVLIPWNKTNIEWIIPISWMHLLSWWSLRWALAIVMALLIPPDVYMDWQWTTISVQSFILALTVGSIMFTTFIKATTIIPLIKKLHIDKLSLIDSITFIESKILFLLGIVDRIELIWKKWYFHPDQKENLEIHYKKAIIHANEEIERIKWKQKNIDDIMHRVVSLYALHIERASLIELFSHGELNEELLRYQLEKIEWQIDRIENGKSQLKDEVEKMTIYPKTTILLQKLTSLFEKTKYKKYEKDYIKYRTRVIILEKVMRHLEVFHEIPAISNHPALKNIIQLYNNLLTTAKEWRDSIRKKHDSIWILESSIIHKTILEQESQEISEMIENEIISKKIWSKLLSEFS